jgi:transposase
MAQPPLPKHLAEQAVKVLAGQGSQSQAARILGISRSTMQTRLAAAERYGMKIPPSQKNHVDTSKRSELDMLNLRIDRLQKEIKSLEKRNRELRDGQLSAEFIRQVIHETKVIPDPPDWYIERDKQSNHGVPTLLCSDWHWGEVVNPRQVNYVNAFDQEIAERRWKRMVEKAINLMCVHMAKPKYDYFCFPLLGDMVSGNIHEELRETNWAPISTCLIQFRDKLIWAIDEFLTAFKKVHLPCVTGNHGRMDRKPRFKNASHDNYEFILYEMLRHHYRSEKAVHFEIAEGSELLYDVAGMRYLALHGDGFKGGSGIAAALSPMMIGRARKKESALATNRPFDCIIHGHWHFFRNLGDIISNGSGKGFDEYALKNAFQYQAPIQALWVTHPDYGVTASWPVYLEDKGVKYH